MVAQCANLTCERESHVKGYCKPHYDKERRRQYWETRKERPVRASFAAQARASGISRQRLDQIRHPEKYRARQAVSYAVKKGTLVRPKVCSRCRRTKTVQAHHSDYSKPLKVQWLCHDCHVAEHRALRIAARRREWKQLKPPR